MNTSLLLWSLLFSSIGLGFFVYGKKQKAVVPLFCGLGLMIYPYFVSSTLLLVAIGVVLSVLPYFVRV
jgi:predicted membrane protein